MIKNKIKSASKLKAILNALKRQGKKIVFTNGCFDILHNGHIKLLKKAKSLGDILVVAVNSDASVKKIKGSKRPFNSAEDRVLVLSAVEFIDFITTFSEPTPRRIIKKLSPDILVKGGDWKKEEIVGRDFVESKGGKIYSIPLAKGYSTSALIKTIAKRYK
jgi:D-beta-D-heptose 7-phosphate kinase/D-beta-D-heptose 1-phosphate adenosyltransferase